MRKPLIALIPFLTACAGEPPTNIGIVDGQLTACPDSPNCVSSYTDTSDEEHSIAAIDATLDQIEAVLVSLDEANIVEAGSDYIYAEFTSRIMGYVDDVEFLLDNTNGMIQVRSASRLGHSDLGANRKRIEAIRNAIQ
jgi:uncharacterized protein (DUF1499 family)